MTAMATTNGNGRDQIMESVVVGGDLSQLQPPERLAYYARVCESVGLNPVTQPFEYLRLNGKLVLYAKRNACDQLRQIHGISVQIVSREQVGDLYVVTARARTPDGREDEDIGAVDVSKTKGESLANAMMKAHTKAKRRVTLSICGLSFMDETEVEAVRGAQHVDVDAETGEVWEEPRALPPPKSTRLSDCLDENSLDAWVRANAAALRKRGGAAITKVVEHAEYLGIADAVGFVDAALGGKAA